MKTKRKKISGAFKAKIAIEALKERETLAELSKRFEVHSNMISKWKREFLSRGSEIFETKPPDRNYEAEREKLYAKIGQLEIEKDYLKKISGRAGV